MRNNWILEDLQCNGLMIYQPNIGYRFTSDAVALANFAKVKPNGVLLDMCSGSGVVGILANAKNKIKHVYMVELQKSLSDMCAKSVEYNKLDNFTIFNQRLQGVHKLLNNINIDTITCNPPYFSKDAKHRLGNEEEVIARHEVEVTLEEIIKECSIILKDGGKLYMSYKASRLVDLITYCRQYMLEPKEIKILSHSKNDQVILLKAIKKGEAGLVIV